jgi:aspartate carbamoyltransferase catalytic subunit
MMRKRDLLGLAELESREIEHLLDSTAVFKAVLERPIPKVPTLRSQTVANLFFENSTRTRISFELAEKRLSADIVNFSASGSSVSKGESLLDTARNIQAMHIDVIVIRHSSAGAPHFLARHLDAAVINAGDGGHEHPTQALLDLYTMREHKQRIAGLRVALVGDIQHSRVARSNLWGLSKLGAQVTVCGPSTLLPAAVERFGCRVTHRIEEAIEGADVIMALRIQLERQRQGRLPSLREYAQLYGLDRARVALARPDVLIMHPGPINRGIEITQEVADGPTSVILEQVTNGVAVRMAALFRASGFDAGALGEEVGTGPGTITAHEERSDAADRASGGPGGSGMGTGGSRGGSPGGGVKSGSGGGPGGGDAGRQPSGSRNRGVAGAGMEPARDHAEAGSGRGEPLAHPLAAGVTGGRADD